MRLPRHLRAPATLAVAIVALALPGSAAAAPPPRSIHPDLYSFSAGRGTYSLAHGVVTLDLARVRKAIPLSSGGIGRLGRNVGVAAVAAAAHPGSTLTVEIGGPTAEDSLSLRVRSVRAGGRRLVVRGTRLGRHARIRARHSWNGPDLRLPPRMRSVGLMLDTDPGGPLLRVHGRPARDVVIAFDHTGPTAASAMVLSEPTTATFHPWPGVAEILLSGQVRSAVFACDVAAYSPEPLEAEVTQNYSVFGSQVRHPEGLPLQLPREGERIPIAVPADHFEIGRGETLYGNYGTTFDVAAEFSPEAEGILGLTLLPPKPGVEVSGEIVCQGVVKGADQSEIGNL